MINTVLTKEGITVVALEGTLDLGKQSKLKEELYKQVPTDRPCLVLNMRKVEFIDSACLGVITGLARRLREKGGDVRLASLHDEVQSILQITRLERIFKIFDTTDDAIRSYSTSE